MDKFLLFIANQLPIKVISESKTPYLERYFIGQVFGLTFYLHRFVGSDPDRGLHDHPWAFAFSLILSGSYIERTRSGDKKVKWFNVLTGDSFHRVVLPVGSPFVWVAFCSPFEICKTLGFLARAKVRIPDRNGRGLERIQINAKWFV